jgi:hypothetical protein
MAARIAIMAMTTRSSINVKAATCRDFVFMASLYSMEDININGMTGEGREGALSAQGCK